MNAHTNAKPRTLAEINDPIKSIVFKQMNQPSKSFVTIVALTVLLCLVIVYFIPHKEDLHSKHAKEIIKEFDGQNEKILQSIADSLINSIGKDHDYFTESRREVRNILFCHLDSTGTPMGYFYPPFKMTDEQADFFLDANIGAIEFDKANKMFFIKVYGFDGDGQDISLRLYKGDKRPLLANSRDSVYANGNRTYVVIPAAW
jgi:hypothetical protein